MNAAPSRAALAALVALVALGGAFVLTLYGLTAPGSRPELLDRLVPAVGFVVAAVPGLLAWLTGNGVARRLERVEHNTNGHLTERLVATNDALREQLIDALGARRRVDDAPLEVGQLEAPALHVPAQRESPLVTGVPADERPYFGTV